MAKEAILELPEHEFTYVAGKADRPWHHFTGRWKAIQPILADQLNSCSKDRPLRVVDLGSCSGYFALQVASRHPEADVVGIEGSVGIGNGTAGVQGGTQQILSTEAAQTHLRWIQRLKLTNCFIAPEVWDFNSVLELVDRAGGRPICDAMFMLSVVHHIDNVSAQQYAKAGLSRVDGGLQLLAKLLSLAPRHFVELPNQPWLEALYARFGTARAILQAAADVSGRLWTFKGPIYSAEWFGQRDTWVIEAQEPMLDVDIQYCPFALLYRGNEEQLETTESPIAAKVQESYTSFQPLDMRLEGGGGMSDFGYNPFMGNRPLGGVLADQELGIAAANQIFTGTLLDPALMALSDPSHGPVSDKVGLALKSASSALLLAHLALREAMNEAQDVLSEVRDLKFGELPTAAQQA